MNDQFESSFKEPSLMDYRPCDFKGNTEKRRDLVEGRLPRGKVVLLAGAGDVGKSFLLLQAFEAVNGGLEDRAFGGRIVSRRLPCLCIMGEDDFESIDLRLKSIRSQFQNYSPVEHGAIIPVPNIGNMQLVRRNYANQIEPTEVMEWLERQIKGFIASHNEVGFIAIDTFSSLLPVNANSPEEVQSALSLLTSIAARNDVCIIVTHHLRKEKLDDSSNDALRASIRGSSAVVDGVRAAYVLHKMKVTEAADIRKELGLDGDGEVVQLSLVKNNLGLRRDPVTYLRMPNGCLSDISSLLGSRLTPEAALWQVVKEANQANRKLNKTGQSGLYSSRLSGWPGGLGNMPKTQIELLANQLIASGVLSTGPNGLIAHEIVVKETT